MKINNDSPLILVDGSSYLFRAFHGLPPLTNSKGMATGAIYGVINMLRSLMKQYDTHQIAVIFDAKGKTFRDDIYPEYKANRPPMPDDLRDQIQPLHTIIKAMGLPLIIEEGVEADDVIGTLSHQATEKKRPTVISTGDKDMAQLVNEYVTLVNTMTNTEMDIEGVKEKFGIPPELIIDFLALKGDKVDNIPGVPGVGDKSALGLLQGIGGINDIYNNLDKIAGLGFRGSKTLAVKMQEFEEQARLSYELATIKLDVEMEITPDSIQNTEADKETLLSLFEDLEFKRWSNDVDGFLHPDGNGSAKNSSSNTGTSTENTESSPELKVVHENTEYETLFTLEALQPWLDKIEKAKLFAFDTETTSLNYTEAELVGFSFSVEANKAAYLPFGHNYPDAPEQLSTKEVLALFKPILESNDIKKNWAAFKIR